jgi:hypothetical protein
MMSSRKSDERLRFAGELKRRYLVRGHNSFFVRRLRSRSSGLWLAMRSTFVGRDRFLHDGVGRRRTTSRVRRRLILTKYNCTSVGLGVVYLIHAPGVPNGRATQGRSDPSLPRQLNASDAGVHQRPLTCRTTPDLVIWLAPVRRLGLDERSGLEPTLAWRS